MPILFLNNIHGHIFKFIAKLIIRICKKVLRSKNKARDKSLEIIVKGMKMELIIESFFRKAKNGPTTIGPYPMKMQRLWYKFERKLALTQWKSANYWCNEKR